MNASKLNDTQILMIINNEIDNRAFEPVCHEQAERESNGNYDLMVSLYLLKRIEVLQGQSLQNRSREDELEARKVDSANKLIRYRTARKSAENANSREQKERGRRVFTIIMSNVILILGVVSVISAFMVLQGHTIYSLPYFLIGGVVVACLIFPYLLSSISIKRFRLPYQTCLKVLCIIMCTGSLLSGMKLLKKNPRNYIAESESSSLSAPAESVDEGARIEIESAKVEPSVVSN